MLTTDRKMLLLPDLLKSAGLIKFKEELYEVLDLDRFHFNNVKNQEKYGRAYHFTAEHLKIVCKVYGVNANWLVDIEENWQRNSSVTLKTTRLTKHKKSTE